MDKKIKGAWVIHPARKLQATLSQDFDAIGFAGKSGTLLNGRRKSTRSWSVPNAHMRSWPTSQ